MSGIISAETKTTFLVPTILTTCQLRYLQLYRDLLGKLDEPNLRVMVLGLGCIRTQSNMSSPQFEELMYCSRGKSQVFDAVDKDKAMLNLSKGYDTTPLIHYFKTMRPRSGVDKSEVNKVLARISGGTLRCLPPLLRNHPSFRSLPTDSSLPIPTDDSMPQRRLFQWDPQRESEPLPREMNETYHVIVATCSAVMPEYITRERELPTWIRLISVLKHRGLLYVDAYSFSFIKREEGVLDKLQKATGSRLTWRKIPPIVEVLPQFVQFCKHELSREDDTQHPERHVNLWRNSIENDGSGVILGGAKTHAIYVLERVVDRIEELAGVFLKADCTHYWHFVAKNSFNASMYSSDKMAKMEGDLKEYPYVSTHHQWTPLHVAVLSGNTAAVKYFLSKKLPVMVHKDEFGMTPQDYAKMYQPHLGTLFQ